MNSDAIDLVARLQGVAAVHEQHRAVGKHDRAAGRAGEAGEPGQALLRRRDIFVLMRVGARQDEAGEPARLQIGAQRREPRGGLRAGGGVVEGLELSLEHLAAI